MSASAPQLIVDEDSGATSTGTATQDSQSIHSWSTDNSDSGRASNEAHNNVSSLAENIAALMVRSCDVMFESSRDLSNNLHRGLLFQVSLSFFTFIFFLE
jgi:hypothetical protein